MGIAKGTKFSEEHKRKISLANKGKISSMNGKRHSKETRRKISLSMGGSGEVCDLTSCLCKCGCGMITNPGRIYIVGHTAKGRIMTDEQRKTLSLARKGKAARGVGWHHSDETKDKLKIKSSGRKLSEEARKKISEGNKGKIISAEHKRILSEVNSGSNNKAWRGGISKEPYTQNWTNKLKEMIRLRDSFRCQLCLTPQQELHRKLHIHHIDYNKKNCTEENLISLCMSCHTKTGFNREQWQSVFAIQ